MKKLSQKESGYIVPKKSVDFYEKKGLRCDNCIVYNLENKTCLYVQGKLNDEGVCNLWTTNHKMPLNFVSGKEAKEILKERKLTYKESGYNCSSSIGEKYRPVKEGKGTRCGSCIYYFNNKCKIVSGNISQYACCNLWTEKGETSFHYISAQKIKEKLIDIEDIGDCYE